MRFVIFILVTISTTEIVPTTTASRAFRWYCRIKGIDPVIEIAQNPTTGEFVRIYGEDDDDNDDDTFGRRHQLMQLGGGRPKDDPSLNLESILDDDDDQAAQLLLFEDELSVPAIRVSRRLDSRRSSNNATTTTTWNSTTTTKKEDWPRYHARSCHCSYTTVDEDYHCLSNFSHCAIPSAWLSTDHTPGCVTRRRDVTFARNSWYFIVGGYALLLGCLLCTNMGRSLFGYLMSCCWPGYNDYIARRLMQKYPDRANLIIGRYWRRRRRDLERQYTRAIGGGELNRDSDDDAASAIALGQEFEEEHQPMEPEIQPIELALKTTIYGRMQKKSTSIPKNSDETSIIIEIMKEEGESDSNHDEDNREDDDEEEEVTCAICFGLIHDEDRVGALPCNHIFHVDPCLKSWLARKNACPLCATEEVATPRYEDEDKETDLDSNDAGEGNEGTQ